MVKLHFFVQCFFPNLQCHKNICHLAMPHKLLCTLHKKYNTFSIKDFFGKCDQIRRNWPKFSFYGNKATDRKFNLNWFNEL